MPAPSSYRHVLLLVAATACWGLGTVLSKHVLDRGVAPLTLLAIELTASSLLLLLATLLSRAPLLWSAHLARLALLGILNPGIAYALGLLGLVTISASLSVLLWATEPVLIMLLAVLLLRERVAAATMVGVAVALVGVLLVLYRPGAAGSARGIALTLGAVAACALYAVLTRWLLLDDSSLTVVLVQQSAALTFAVALVATTGLTGSWDLGLPTDAATWVLAAASGAVYYGLAFWLFIGGLRGVPASVAGSLFPLIPVFGLAAAYVAGDRLTDRQWIGAVVVVVAIASATAYHLIRPPVGVSASRPAPP
jgi:drug/metabolite transporter (DMT)-like permease